MSGYLGSKGNIGVWRRIAREVPQCDVLVSPFAGQCAVMRMMQPPRVRVAIDRDPEVVEWWGEHHPDVAAFEADSIAWLEEVALNVLAQINRTCPQRANFERNARSFARWMGLAKSELRSLCDDGRVTINVGGEIIRPLPFTTLARQELLARIAPAESPFLTSVDPWSPTMATLPTVIDWHRNRIVLNVDPPYVLSTRSHPDSLYRCEMTDADHVRLIRALRWLPCCVILCGYDSALYRELLTGWRQVDYPSMTRGGPRTETMWLNSDAPTVPHDPQFVGTDKRQREVIKRRQDRLRRRIAEMTQADLHFVKQLLHLEVPSPQLASTAEDLAAGSGDSRATWVSVGRSDTTTHPIWKTNARRGCHGTDLAVHGIDASRAFLSASGWSSVTCDGAIGERGRAPHAGRGGVLSLFTGLGLLDRAFEELGFTVDSAGDLQFGKPIESYRGRLHSHEGIIAGPPCQTWSSADPRRTPKSQVDFTPSSTHAGVRTLRELLRVIDEVQPEWFLVECVPGVPDLIAGGYHVQRLNLTDVECGGTQRRLRSIQFGSRSLSPLNKGGVGGGTIQAGVRPPLTPPSKGGEPRDGAPIIIRPSRLAGRVATEPAVLASKCREDEVAFERRCRTMGLEVVPDLSAFTKATRFRLVGNGVPLTMGRVLARAVTERGPVTESDCICGCGQLRQVNSQYSAASNASCRKRVNRRKSERFFVDRPSPDVASAVTGMSQTCGLKASI